MFKCVLILLAVIGCSTSFRREDVYSSHPSYHSKRPGQWGPPERNHHHSSHSGSWHHNSGYQGEFETFNPNAGHSGPQTKPSYSSQTGLNAHDDSGYHSETDSDDDDHDGNVSDEKHDQHNADADSQKSKGSHKNGTLETEKLGRNKTGQSVAKPKPLENNRVTLNRGDLPPEDEINPRKSYIEKPNEGTNNTTSNTFMTAVDQTKETEANLTAAYITGPDNTLVKDLTANNTEKEQPSQSGSSKPSTATSIRTSVKKPEDFPSTPKPFPSIGSIPVPALGQFLAPSLQWNVGIYSKMTTPYSQICGGSLVKTDTVLTAAHCFWADGGSLRPARFAAAAGKLQRRWDDAADVYAQQSDIKEIHIPPRFHGAMTSFQDDLAIAKLTTPFQYAPGVMPVCVDFDAALEKEQLAGEGSKGTIVGWGLTEPDGPPSNRLNFLELPHLEIRECLKLIPASFIKYITSDKICAGDFYSGKAACKGDSGGGLVYTSNNVPYIRGIISTAPRNTTECNPFTPATFTQITAHMSFLTDHIPDIAEDCRTMYEVIQTSAVESGTNVTEESRTLIDVQKTESKQSNESESKTNSCEERKSKVVPVSFNLYTKDEEARECNCFCDKF